MNSAVAIIAALVLGGAASVAGGYIGGVSVGAKIVGKEFAGYMGMLYSPVAGVGGVIIGTIAVVALGRE